MIFRYPKGYAPGIPTLSKSQASGWTIAAKAGVLTEYLQKRGDVDVIEQLVDNTQEIGLTRDEILFHLGQVKN